MSDREIKALDRRCIRRNAAENRTVYGRGRQFVSPDFYCFKQSGRVCVMCRFDSDARCEKIY